jgi:hypothetical protein
MLIKRKIKPAELGDAPTIWTPIDAIDINGLAGSIQVGVSRKWNTPRRYDIAFDDLWDLVEAIEVITLEHGGRVYRRPAPIVARERLALTRVIACTAASAPVDRPPDWEGDRGFYMGTVIDDELETTYHNFFVHLEDLVALLHQAVRDAQGITPTKAAAAVGRTLH